MEDEEKLSYRRLHNRTYRSLQQLAKSLALPSNFKVSSLLTLIGDTQYIIMKKIVK